MGGVWCQSAGLTLANSVIWGNARGSLDVDGGSITVAFSNIEGGAGEPWFGVNCLDLDPLLTPGWSPHRWFAEP